MSLRLALFSEGSFSILSELLPFQEGKALPLRDREVIAERVRGVSLLSETEEPLYPLRGNLFPSFREKRPRPRQKPKKAMTRVKYMQDVYFSVKFTFLLLFTFRLVSLFTELALRGVVVWGSLLSL